MNDDVDSQIKFMLGFALVATILAGLQGGLQFALPVGLLWLGVAFGMNWFSGRIDVCRSCTCGNCKDARARREHARL